MIQVQIKYECHFVMRLQHLTIDALKFDVTLTINNKFRCFNKE